MSFFPIQFRLFRVRILKVRKLSALVPRNVWFNQNVPVLLKWNLCWIFGDRFVNSYIVAELNRCIDISTCAVRCDSVMQIKMFGVIYNYYIPSEVSCLCALMLSVQSAAVSWKVYLYGVNESVLILLLSDLQSNTYKLHKTLNNTIDHLVGIPLLLYKSAWIPISSQLCRIISEGLVIVVRLKS